MRKTQLLKIGGTIFGRKRLATLKCLSPWSHCHFSNDRSPYFRTLNYFISHAIINRIWHKNVKLSLHCVFSSCLLTHILFFRNRFYILIIFKAFIDKIYMYALPCDVFTNFSLCNLIRLGSKIFTFLWQFEVFIRFCFHFLPLTLIEQTTFSKIPVMDVSFTMLIALATIIKKSFV